MLNTGARLQTMSGPGRLLSARMIGFVAFLRENGFELGVDDAASLVDVAARLDVFDPRLLRWSAQALLCRHAAQREHFHTLFDAWFLPPNRRRHVRSRGTGRGELERGVGRQGGDIDRSEGMPVAASDDAAAPPPASGGTAQRGASAAESLATMDFRHLHRAEDMRVLDAMMRDFARGMRRLALRRERAGGSRRVDLRRTARRSLGRGGEPLDLLFRQRRRERPRLIVLLDVSRSMNLYSFFFLRLARALLGAHWDTHVFIWHTHLSAVSASLRDPDPWRARERLQLLSAGWAGGTRMGACLAQFEREHAALIHARTALVVVSDGYDTGAPALLVQALQRLRRRARRLLWLNPLAGRADYQPLAQGIAAAMPYLDLHAPAHDLASVRRVLRPLLLALR